MQDNLVSVIEESKEQKELIANHLAQAAQIQLSTDNQQQQQQHLQQQQQQQQTLTVQQLQQLQALDNVVRMESSMENHQNQNNEDGLSDNLHIVKDEKVHKFVIILFFIFSSHMGFGFFGCYVTLSLFRYPVMKVI